MFIAKKPAIRLEIHGPLERVFITKSSKGFTCQFHDTPNQKEIITWLESYAQKKPIILPPFFLNTLPPFTKKVLHLLSTISFGQTKSYREIAQLLHNPNGARPVGNACGRNPLPLFIPCHRVLATNHQLGGYTGGIEIKKELLSFEEITI